MHEKRHFHTVLMLMGPASDRDRTQVFFEQAGFRAQVFKNPDVFFDELKVATNPLVVLETFALKCKMSEWVQRLTEINPQVSWVVVAPISQYTIVASYQNRGLVDFITNDQPYMLERLLWALDRQASKEEMQQTHRRLQEELILARQATLMIEEDPGADFTTRLQKKFRENNMKQKPLTLLTISLDDEGEISEFWGRDILKKARELLLDLSVRKWGMRDVQAIEDKILVMVSKTTEEVLPEAVDLQTILQDEGRQQLGFRVSFSAGLAESYVHSEKIGDLRKLTEEALRHMQSKGGGRVGVPKAIQGGQHRNVPSDVGRD